MSDSSGRISSIIGGVTKIIFGGWVISAGGVISALRFCLFTLSGTCCCVGACGRQASLLQIVVTRYIIGIFLTNSKSDGRRDAVRSSA